jgi:hypothetical protein
LGATGSKRGNRRRVKIAPGWRSDNDPDSPKGRDFADNDNESTSFSCHISTGVSELAVQAVPVTEDRVD